MHEKLLNTKRAGLLSAFCFALYLAQYLGRYCLSACISNMVANGFFTKTELGTVATCFFAAYAIMQIPSGLLGDRLRASRLVGLGIAGSTLITFAFTFIQNIALMRILWFINGILQALVWPGLMHILSDVNSQADNPEKPLMSIVTLTLSGPVGVLLSYGLCALMLRYVPYRYCFLTSGFMMTVIVLAWFLLAMPMLVPGDRKAPGTAVSQYAAKGNAFWKEMLSAALPMVLLVAFCHGLLKDGLTTWIPTYLTETLGLANDTALLLTTLLPIVNFGAVYLADFLNKKLFRNEMTASAACFALTLLVLAVMIASCGNSVPGTVLCFLAVSLLMVSVNTLILSFMPLCFTRLSLVSTVTGIIDSIIYVGSALSTTVFAVIAENYGWSGTRVLWCLFAAAGLVFSLIPITKWKRFKDKNP